MQQRLAEFDRRAVVDADFLHRAASRRGNRVHGLHRFDDEQRVAFLDLLADFDEGRLARFRRGIDRADHGRGDGAGLRTGGWCGSDGRRGERRRPLQAAAAMAAMAPARGDADARAVVLDLDFGQAGFRQKIGQARGSRRRRCPACCRTGAISYRLRRSFLFPFGAFRGPPRRRSPADSRSRPDR